MRETKVPDVVGSSGSGSSERAIVRTRGCPAAGPPPHAVSAGRKSAAARTARSGARTERQDLLIPGPDRSRNAGVPNSRERMHGHAAGRHFLQIPGPTNVPERVLRAMAAPTIDHRGPEFAALVADLLERLPEVFRCSGPVVVYPSSGTGAWEAALVNTLSPGDRVLAFETGHFATLWRALAERLGLKVDFVPGDWRHGVDPDDVAARLQADRAGAIRAVCVVHNETSTGVASRVAEVR